MALSRWVLDPDQSQAQFTVRHLMFSQVKGTFRVTEGPLLLDRDHPESCQVDATLEVASVDTRDTKRDEHLRSDLFFHVAQFPVMKFNSNRFSKKSNRLNQFTGNLTLHGVTRELTLEVKGLDAEKTDASGIRFLNTSATTRLKRKEFGLEWNAAIEAGGVLVGDEIEIQIQARWVLISPAS